MKCQRNVLFILLFSMLFFIGCSKGSDSFYPLKEGIIWTYQASAASMFGSTGSNKIVVTNFASRDLKGKKVTPQKQDVNGQTLFSFIAASCE